MADVRNFVIPEADQRGLHIAANTFERKRERDDMAARQREGKRAASMSFLSNYLNPQDHLTGTNYDPQIVAGFDSLLQEGAKLASEGADTNMIMMALSPKVAKLNQYSTTAKLINQRVKDQLAQIPANAGYDKKNLEEQARRTAFYDADGKLKDISTIDPNHDYVTETIKMYPDVVTNDAAFDEFVNKSPKYVNTQRVKRTNSKGGVELKNTKVTKPNWSIVDEAGEIVPRFDVATDGGEIMYGGDGKSPIRLMNEKDFDSIMSSNPGIADFIRGQVKLAGENPNLSSTQAKNAARAIMYEELKRRGGGGIEDIEEVKENPAPRISVRVGGGSSSGEMGIRDIYKEVKTKSASGDKIPLGLGVALNELSASAQKILIEYANKLTGGDMTQADILVRQDPDGTINIVDAESRKVIAPIDFGDVNLPAQPGIKEKREVINKNKEQQSKQPSKSGITWK